MKKVLLILALFASLTLDAQYVTTNVRNASLQGDVISYNLPRNMIKLEVTVEETSYYIGPYAEFASELLGTNDYIKENKTEINIKNIDIQLGTEADPNALFFVENDEKSKEPMPNLILDYDGIIKAVGFDNIPSEMNIERNCFVYDNTDYTDQPSVTFIEIIDNQEDEDADDDEEEEGKGSRAPKKLTKEDKAKIAVEKIDKIRNAYFELVSGFQEVSYGDALPCMVKNIKDIENEYVSLFKGKKTTRTYKQYFYITPEKNHANATITCGRLENGDAFKIQFDTKNGSANIAALNDEDLNTAQTNKIFYRIPAQTNITVTYGKDILVNKVLIISQFGEYRLILPKNNKILFNPNTGQIVTVSR